MESPDFETVDWSFDEPTGVGRIVLDRPDSLNALSATLRREFVEAFDAFRALDHEADGVAVRAVVVSGNGRAFSAGADVDEFAEGSDLVRPKVVYDAAGRFEGPVVAAIDGYCMGGGPVIALDCDVRFASQRSEFGLPEVDVGIPATGGGLAALSEAIGPGRAKWLAVTGERFDGAAAAADGIVDVVCAADDLDDRVDAFVETLASKPPLAVRGTLAIVDAYGEGGVAEVERRADRRCRRSEDHRAAVEAFRHDTDPEFHGR
jgi:enoyl-CoA hydratase/3-hydroxyacyl-CoA dehydrogenase